MKLDGNQGLASREIRTWRIEGKNEFGERFSGWGWHVQVELWSGPLLSLEGVAGDAVEALERATEAAELYRRLATTGVLITPLQRVASAEVAR